MKKQPRFNEGQRYTTQVDLAILASIWLIFTLPFLIAGRTLLPVDWHGVTPGGASGYPAPRQPHFYSLDPDSASGFELAGYGYVANSVRSGRIPFWNPYQHLGIEYLGEGGTLVLYPFNFLRLVLPPAYWDLPQFLQFYCAAFGLYLLAKTLGFQRSHALACGAAAFAAGFLQGYLGVTALLSGMVWTPFVLIAIERALEANAIRPALLPGAIGTYLLGTSCNPGLGIIIIFSVSLYALARAGMSRKYGALLKAGVPLAIGVLCSAPILLPFLHNAVQFRGFLASEGNERPLNLLQLPGLFLPYIYSPMRTPGAFGDPSALNESYWTCAYLTPPLAFLALTGLVLAIKSRRQPMLILGGIAAWLWLWLMAVPPFNALSRIPILWRLSTNYVMAPIELIACLLAGYAISRLSMESLADWRLILGLWGAFLFGLLAIAARVYQETARPDIYWVLGSSVPAILWAVIPAAALWWASRAAGDEHRSRVVPVVAVSGLIASGVAFFPSGADIGITFWLRIVPLLVFVLTAALVVAAARAGRYRSGWGWAGMIAALLAMNSALVLRLPAWPVRYNAFTAPEFVKYLQQNAATWRTYMTDLMVFPNFPSAFGIPSVNVLATLAPATGAAFFQRFLEPYEPPTQIYGVAGRVPGAPMIPPVQLVIRNKRYWDYIGVRYIVSSANGAPLDPALFELSLRDPPASLWRNRGAQPILYVAPESWLVTDWKRAQDRFARAADLRRVAFLESENAPMCPSNREFPAAEPAADISEIRIEPNRVYASVQARTGGTLVLVTNYSPGWSAQLNGIHAQVRRVNGAFQGVCLNGPGNYRVVFEFVPPYWQLGLICAVAGGLILVFLLSLAKLVAWTG